MSHAGGQSVTSGDFEHLALKGDKSAVCDAALRSLPDFYFAFSQAHFLRLLMNSFSSHQSQMCL